MRISDWSSDVCSSDLDELHDLGRRAGSESAQEWGRQAEANRPELRTHDRYGNRIDVVEYHPAYHQLMSQAVRAGLHAAPWSDDRPGAHVARESGRANVRKPDTKPQLIYRLQM